MVVSTREKERAGQACASGNIAPQAQRPALRQGTLESNVDFKSINEDLAKVIELFSSITGIKLDSSALAAIPKDEARGMTQKDLEARGLNGIIIFDRQVYASRLERIIAKEEGVSEEFARQTKIKYAMDLANGAVSLASSSPKVNQYSSLGREFAKIFSLGKTTDEEMQLAANYGAELAAIYRRALAEILAIVVLSKGDMLSGPFTDRSLLAGAETDGATPIEHTVSSRLFAMARKELTEPRNGMPAVELTSTQLDEHQSRWVNIVKRYMSSQRDRLEDVQNGIGIILKDQLQRNRLDPSNPSTMVLLGSIESKLVNLEGNMLAGAILYKGMDTVKLLRNPNLLIDVYSETGVERREDSTSGMYA